MFMLGQENGAEGLRVLQLSINGDNWNVKFKTHPEEFTFSVIDWVGRTKNTKTF